MPRASDRFAHTDERGKLALRYYVDRIPGARDRFPHTDEREKLALRYYFDRMPGVRDHFALPARLCLSYCLTRVIIKQPLKL
jgi:hypothetical protein